MEYYMTLFKVAAWAAAAVMLCLSIVFLKPRPCPQPVPDDAASIGGGYMLVWASDRRVHVRFRNNGVTVLFDRRAAREFGEWLCSLRPDADSDRTDKAAPRPSEGAGDTQETQTTPGKCIKTREGTSEPEPVAWWVRGCEYDTGCEYEFVTLLKEQAEFAATQSGKVVPLYRSPTLTSAEREAVEIAIGLDDSGPLAATLRGLLERTRVEPPDLTVSFRSSPHHRQHVAGSNTGQNSGV